MTQKQVIQVTVNDQTRIIVESSVSSIRNKFYGYKTAIEKRNRGIELRLWLKRLFDVRIFIIAVFSRLLKWLNGVGSNEIDLRRLERRNDSQLGIRRWSL